MNPYVQGKADQDAGKPSANPYPEFSAKWGQYNMGYNYKGVLEGWLSK